MGNDVTIRMLGLADATVLENVADNVFDNAVNPALAEEFLADPRHHMAVALKDDQVIGIASAMDYIHPDKPRAMWVNEIGVDDAYQNQGIGRKLITELLNHARKLGCSEAWLGTEVENLAARRAYTAAGGKEEPMVYFTFTLDAPKQAGE